jgi:hypothetical protein
MKVYQFLLCLFIIVILSEAEEEYDDDGYETAEVSSYYAKKDTYLCVYNPSRIRAPIR